MKIKVPIIALSLLLGSALLCSCGGKDRSSHGGSRDAEDSESAEVHGIQQRSGGNIAWHIGYYFISGALMVFAASAAVNGNIEEANKKIAVLEEQVKKFEAEQKKQDRLIEDQRVSSLNFEREGELHARALAKIQEMPAYRVHCVMHAASQDVTQKY